MRVVQRAGTARVTVPSVDVETRFGPAHSSGRCREPLDRSSVLEKHPRSPRSMMPLRLEVPEDATSQLPGQGTGIGYEDNS